MSPDTPGGVAIVCPGDRDARERLVPERSRFADLFREFASRGMHAELAVYHDDFRDEVRRQLLTVDAALVWVNPIEGGHDRAALDFMLRDVAAAGVFVSTHPDIILELGTKEVLYRTRDLGWGCDTHLYGSIEQLRKELPGRLAGGRARVLKQLRGNGGDGVWKVQLPAAMGAPEGTRGASSVPSPETVVHVRHAKRGCTEEAVTLEEFFGRCEPYFRASGRMIEQEYQERLADGMIRCYLVHDRVAGFGHQAINALYPAPPGAAPAEAPQPGPRLYHPPTMPAFQALKRRLEMEWVPALEKLLDVDRDNLPVLWDCDFLLGPRDDAGDDSYVLCEINVSSVAPYPPSAVPLVVEAAIARVKAARQHRRKTT